MCLNSLRQLLGKLENEKKAEGQGLYHVLIACINLFDVTEIKGLVSIGKSLLQSLTPH